MFRKLATFLLYLILVLSLGLLFAVTKYPEADLYVKQLLGIAPCQKPLQYSLGSFDNKFGISQEDFLSDVEKAEAIWEKVLNKNLFQYHPEGKLKLNLTYDYRQDATDKLKDLGLTIDNTKESYDQIKAEYQKLSAKYNSDNSALEALVAEFKARKQKYDTDVAYWNKRGGASKDTYESMTAERESLQALVDKINKTQDALNKEANNINAVIDTLNKIAKEINVGVQTYNKIGQSTGEEFSEGLYISDPTGTRIDIFQFNDRAQLVRLLTHELGHALGMEHINDPDSIMYRLNESKNLTTTAADIAELKSVCRIN